MEKREEKPDCLHCEVAMLLKKRVPLCATETIGCLTQVLADIVASAEPPDRRELFNLAHAFLDRFEEEVSKGNWHLKPMEPNHA